MGLFQRAVQTYDAMSRLVGVKEEGKEPLAPIGHMITTAKIEITVDQNGNFVKARNIEDKVPIPCTEKSSGRSSGLAAHPLCDNIEYVSERIDDKHNLYVKGLKQWTESGYESDKLDAIYRYVCKGTVYEDCLKEKVIKTDKDGDIVNRKDIIIWRVEGLGENSGSVVWDKDLQNNFALFYLSVKGGSNGTCMLTGKTELLATQHLKGVSNYAGNAKLISANDTANFTYLGRFINDAEALTVGYESSQKAHNALKWLVSNYGVSMGNRRLVCWNPSGEELPVVNNPILRMGTGNNRILPSDYKEQLKDALRGYRNKLPEKEYVIIAGFEAATSGRLSVTYYNELKGSDFLDRLYYWDSTCCFCSSRWGTGSPSLYQIINYAYGTSRGTEENAKIETDPRILGQQMQRLISCRIDKAMFPADIVKSMVTKAERLENYSKNNRESMLFTVCSIIRKYRFDNYREVWELSLEKDRKDRSYQYGRLLAVMEKIEKDTYDREEERETNAIRSQAFFVQRPMAAYSQVMTQLKAGYYPRLSIGARKYYEKLIGEIMEMISEFDEKEIGKSLSETYLMGYYLQKNALYTKAEDENKEEN